MDKADIEREISELDLPMGEYTNADVSKVELVEGAKYNYYRAIMNDGRKFRFRRVSTILNTLGGRKVDNLIDWAVGQSCDLYQDRLQPGKSYTKAELDSIHKDAPKARWHTQKEARDIGTTAHEWIEAYLKHGVEGPMEDQDPRVQNCVELFKEWFSSEDLTVLDAELYVYDCRFKVAGTLDFLCVNGKGEVMVWDWKTSKGIYEEYLLQVAAYVGLLVASGNFGVPKSAAILRIGKEDAAFQVYKFKENEWLFHYKQFLRLNAVYEWQNEASKLLKSNWIDWKKQDEARRQELWELERQRKTAEAERDLEGISDEELFEGVPF